MGLDPGAIVTDTPIGHEDTENSAAQPRMRFVQTRIANSTESSQVPFFKTRLRFQELAQARTDEIVRQDVVDAGLERVPPEFSRAGSSHKYNWSTDTNAPDSFDEISPIAINQGELCDDHGLLARRQQTKCRIDAARPLHDHSVRFDVLSHGGFWTPAGYKNYCSFSFVGLHQSSHGA